MSVSGSIDMNKKTFSWSFDGQLDARYIGLKEAVEKNRKRGFVQCNVCGILLSMSDKSIVKEHMKEVEQVWVELVKRHHPDRGGDASKFVQIKEAYEKAKARVQ